MNLRHDLLQRALLACAASTLAAALSACTGDHAAETGDVGTSSPSAAAGRAAYLAHCSACHQREGGGLSSAFPPLAGTASLREQPTERSIGIVLRGLSGPITVDGVAYNAVMPAMGYLADRDIAAILTHVYGNWGNDGRVVTAAMVATVRSGGSLSSASDAAGGGEAASDAADQDTPPDAPAG